jgi:hypothetical protein
MSEGKKQSDSNGLFALLHQFPGYVIDCGDVIGIDSVSQPQPVCDQGSAEQHRLAMEGRPRPGPDGKTESDENNVDDADASSD